MRNAIELSYKELEGKVLHIFVRDVMPEEEGVVSITFECVELQSWFTVNEVYEHVEED